MRVIVLHRYFGCSSGCCGHAIEVDGEEKSFDFEHPYSRTNEEFIRELVTEKYGAEHVKDIDFENCVISDD